MDVSKTDWSPDTVGDCFLKQKEVHLPPPPLREDTRRNIYKRVIRPLFFTLPPETAHNLVVGTGNIVSHISPLLDLVEIMYGFDHVSLQTDIMGFHFNNPVGLAAGYDKNGVLPGFLPSLGFGFEEIGSVTAQNSKGNKKPREFRLAHDEALINRMGLNNNGAFAVHEKLKDSSFPFPVGINIAKTNDTTILHDQAIEDYVFSYTMLQDLASFIVLNISCPNTLDGKTFADPGALTELLSAIQQGESHQKALLLKLSPDLSFSEIDGILQVGEDHGITGYVIGNTTMKRDDLKTDPHTIEEIGKGGLSGPSIRERTTQQITYVHKHLPNRTIIGVGGINSGRAAYEKIKAGASLIEVLTALPFEGPMIIKHIKQDLVQLLKRDGFLSVAEAVGTSK
jgi:dihydroorotate dehydrogenase